MATCNEREILKIIDEEGGECSEVKISRCMGLGLTYVRSMLVSMGIGDYIDVFRSGKVNIADKGWRVLGKSPKAPWAEFRAEDEPPMTPQEKFERYMSRGAKETSSKKPEHRTPETIGEFSKSLKKKTQKASEGSYRRKTMEELAEEASLTPEEKFKRYISRCEKDKVDLT